MVFNTSGYGLYSFYSENNSYFNNYFEKGSYVKRFFNNESVSMFNNDTLNVNEIPVQVPEQNLFIQWFYLAISSKFYFISVIISVLVLVIILDSIFKRRRDGN